MALPVFASFAAMLALTVASSCVYTPSQILADAAVMAASDHVREGSTSAGRKAAGKVAHTVCGTAMATPPIQCLLRQRAKKESLLLSGEQATHACCPGCVLLASQQPDGPCACPPCACLPPHSQETMAGCAPWPQLAGLPLGPWRAG